MAINYDLNIKLDSNSKEYVPRDETEPESLNLTFGSDNDSIHSISENLTVSSGSGDDLIEHEGADSYLNGGNGDDTLLSTSSNVTMVGGMGDDLIMALGERAQVSGGGGDDTIYSGELSTITPGDGADIVVFSPQAKEALVLGWRGEDTLSISGGLIGSVTTLGSDVVVGVKASSLGSEVAKVTLDSAAGRNLILASNSGHSISAVETGALRGSAQDDTIFASAAGATISAINGNNLLSISGDNSLILGGSGSDSVTLAGAGDTYALASGASALVAGVNKTANISVSGDYLRSIDSSALSVLGNDVLAPNLTLIGAVGEEVCFVSGSERKGFIVNAEGEAVQIIYADSAGEYGTAGADYVVLSGGASGGGVVTLVSGGRDSVEVRVGVSAGAAAAALSLSQASCPRDADTS